MGQKSRKPDAAQSARDAQSNPVEASKHTSPRPQLRREKESKKHRRNSNTQSKTSLSNGVASNAAGPPVKPTESQESKVKDKKKRKHPESKDVLLRTTVPSVAEPQSSAELKYASSDEDEATEKSDEKKRKRSDDGEKSSSKKAKKQKHSITMEDGFIPLDCAVDAVPEVAIVEGVTKKSKKAKSSKPASDPTIMLDVGASSGTLELPLGQAEKVEKKKKKRKPQDGTGDTSQSKKVKKRKTSSKPEDSLSSPSEHSVEAIPAAHDDSDMTANTGKKTRFIVFVGNLPFTTTSASLAEHFVKIHPDSIRHITQRAGEVDKTLAKQSHNSKRSAAQDAEEPKSKGFAFLEFASYDRMRTCLKLYHHSVFEDRKINVELTAGGGGKKSGERKEKLKAKNERLNGQRQRRSEEEVKAKAKKGAKPVPDNDRQDGQGEIHPSRRAQIPEGR